MKILHYSDKKSPIFDKLYSECDILVATGDLKVFDFGNLLFSSVRKPAFGVYGNHCSGKYFDELGITNLHNTIKKDHGLLWGGFQGCLQYKTSGIFFTEEEANSFSKTFPYVDILLLHAGPKGMLDDPSDSVHIGSEAIANYIRTKQPSYVFCGHQYSNAEMVIGKTKLIRTYEARIIEI